MAGSGHPARELLRLRLAEGSRFVGVAASAAAGVAEGLGFGPEDVERVTTLVEALCLDVVECHFDEPAQAEFSVSVLEHHGGLRVRIEDEGLPYPVDRFSLDDSTLLGRRHVQGGADSLRYESHGLGGNALELRIERAPHRQRHLAADEAPTGPPVEDDAPIRIQALTSREAPGLARCVYRCYGYTYGHAFVYYPDQVLSLIERGLLRSFVALDPEGEVVGHSGLLRDHPESPVAESGIGLVDPRYRRHHLLHSLKAHQAEAIAELGLIGTYADAVAIHEITQKANATIGARETGVLLGEIPEFTVFRGFEDRPRQRGSVVVYYHALGEAPPRDLFLPERLRGLLESIYDRLELRRRFRAVSSVGRGDPSALHVEVDARRGVARIEIEAAGPDLAAQVTQRLRELCRQALAVIHLDVPLGDAGAVTAVEGFAELGFFFGCVIPELRGGDVLRLQYLNDVELDPDRLVLYTDEAKQLLRAALSDRA